MRMQQLCACSQAISYLVSSCLHSASQKSLTSVWNGTFCMVSESLLLLPQKVTPLISMKVGWPRVTSLAYSDTSLMLKPLTRVSRYTVLTRLSLREVREAKKRSQKSEKRGRSTSLSSCLVDASTDTYSWHTGSNVCILSGNCALVTRKDEMFLSCSILRYSLILGYMMGSPTSDSAQCLTVNASWKRAGCTPGTPFIVLIICWCLEMAASIIISGGSITHFHSLPTGLVWCRQQKTHLLAQASEGVISMHW
mmetsp:Transcript_19971/g.28095  ORF Transcript_19971/g.28095 Transcript_19971/m.28095 type:complete len:252 (-) Transcript_19971:266-1021(-)